jgi:hypothetical protein|tara:strand:+ start:1375 stop:1719 length:345 start_codon:yes stop_codon:yes gene_type:complete
VQQVHAHIDTVEAGYEFLLAYAAQGREDDDGSTGSARETLSAMDSALASLREILHESAAAFHQVTANDIGAARAAIELVLAAPRLSSELVDNLNASIHLRTVLTDLFIVGEADG